MRIPSVSNISALSDQAIDWVIRLHSGQASKQDVVQAEQWRQRSDSHRKAFAEAEQLWREMGEVLLASEPLYQPTPVKTPKRRWSVGLAAAFALFSSILYISGFSDRWLSDYYTATGEQKTVSLADGSRVLLDTDTALMVAFDETGRHITLQRGQALFTVAKDATRPFEVTTGTAVVRALGTVFEVAEEPHATRVTVIEHAVGIKGLHAKDYAPSARIDAGQQARYRPETGLEGPMKVELQQISAWQRGKLIFKNQPLAQVIAELDRYYPGRMVIVNRKLKALRVTGVFPADDPTGALTMIADILPVNITHVTPWLTLLSG
jgi:transmembrane sensor